VVAVVAAAVVAAVVVAAVVVAVVVVAVVVGATETCWNSLSLYKNFWGRWINFCITEIHSLCRRQNL
jgi:hypothetical protein